MAWQDRQKIAAYNSPSGVRLEFNYENVSKFFEKKTAAFEFPDADGTFVQDLGHTGRRYPFRVIFTGDNYDLEADQFEEMLFEQGQGKLEHPMYGEVDVVPFGKVTRRDDLKTAGNQAIYEIVFWETTGLIYPTPQLDPAIEVVLALDAFAAASAETFEQASNLETAGERATLKGQYKALLGAASSGLQAIASTQDDVAQLFNSVSSSINQGIDVLIAEPLMLAFQTSILIQTPGRALTSITARLDAYKNLAESIIGTPAAPTPLFTPDPTPGAISDPSKVDNRLLAADLYALNYVAGAIVSTVNAQFATKTEAIEAAEEILAQLDAVNDWRDANFQALEQIDTGEAYQQIQTAAAIAAGFLIDISFSLKQERRIVLSKAHSVIPLVAELYGEVDAPLDFFIRSNNLTGDEILLEIPKGREIVYYI